jgi:D-3-phosphoglycerate dehydrogenase
MSFRVLVTARSFCNTPGEHHDFLREQGCQVDLRSSANSLTAVELSALIPGYDGAILGLDRCDASVIERADRLRVISRYGVGVDEVDLDAASQRGIVVANTPGANQTAVAELTIGLIFTLARDIPGVAQASRNGQWKRSAGWELTGKTLGIIGFGAIGRDVARRAHALGMKVIAYDPVSHGEAHGVEAADLMTVLREADVISLHCALTPETHDLINAQTIEQMKPGAYLINTARGGLVDEDALYAALNSARLAGAAADVFKREPPNGSPLLTLDNFIATPHIGATTRESVLRMSMMAAQNLVAVLRGEPCGYIVNAEGLRRQHG